MLMAKTRVIVFDDNPSRRESLQLLISSYNDLEFCGAFEDCAQVLEDVSGSMPDVILMDIDMPRVNGITGVSLVRKKFPAISVIMQTVFEDDEKVFASILAGANGYILKKTSPEKIIEAIREAAQGGAPMTPAIAAKVLRYFRENADRSGTNTYDLTEREKEVLGLLVEGLSYKMVAERISLSYHTVNTHVRHIYEKLHVHSLGEAVSKALRERLI